MALATALLIRQRRSLADRGPANVDEQIAIGGDSRVLSATESDRDLRRIGARCNAEVVLELPRFPYQSMAVPG